MHGPPKGGHYVRKRRYCFGVDDVELNRERRKAGLCADCQHARTVESSRQSTFYLCERSATDPTYRKYPQLPSSSVPGTNVGRPEGLHYF